MGLWGEVCLWSINPITLGFETPYWRIVVEQTGHLIGTAKQRQTDPSSVNPSAGTLP